MSFERKMRHFNHGRLLPIVAVATLIAACAQGQPSRPAPKAQDPRPGDGFFEPEPGREADFFRAVDVQITVDFDKPSITFEPFDPYCPDEEAERTGKCNIVRFEAPKRAHGKGMNASADETMAFFEDLAQGDTAVYRMPRIFYPPTSTAETSRLAKLGCRPEFPARQYRWTVLCKDGSNTCLRQGDQVIIRPKVSDDQSQCEVRIPRHNPNFAVLDRLAAVIPEYKCLQDFPSPKMAQDPPRGDRSARAMRRFMGSKEYAAYVERHNAHFTAKERNDLRQAKTLFSPQTGGTFSITAACGAEASECPSCCRASALSGIPYRPKFLKPVSGIMWDYGIELWRGGQCIAELDPPAWTEDDGGGPGPGGG